MKKKIITGREVFDFLAGKYGTGNKTTMKIMGYRNICEIIPVKIFPEDSNSNGKNKAAIVFHEDEGLGDFSILFCSSMPNNGNIDRILSETTPSLHPENPSEGKGAETKFNISYGEGKTSRIPRIRRIRGSHDKFDMVVRILDIEITRDITYLAYSLPCEKTRSSILEI